MKRDFTDSAYNELISLIQQVENEKWCDFTDWIGDGWYTLQEWIGLLNIERYLDNVNNYHKKVIDKNNASKDTIDKIFTDVKNVDQNYATRLAAYKTLIEELTTLIEKFSNVISPSNGISNVNLLKAFITTYEDNEKYLKIIGGDGLNEEDLENINDMTMSTIVEGISTTLIELFPDIKVGEKVEVPVGPGLSIYYSVNATIEGNSDMDLNLTTEDQKLKFKNISYSASGDGELSFGVTGNTEGKVSVSLESDRTSFSINNNGELEGKATVKVGNDTYTVKLTASLEEVVFEESIKTDIEGGSITSSIGIRKTTDVNSWKPIPVPIPDTSPVTLPQFELPDINWGYVAAGAVVGVVVAGAIILAPETGGASLALNAVV